MADEVIRVSAVVVRRADGRVLTVRKAGTVMFMFPGGKHDDGESPLQTARRELVEETGLTVALDELDHLGAWDTAAANEPGRLLHSEVFAVARQLADHEVPVPAAEIEQLAWMDPHHPVPPGGFSIAPLLLELFGHLSSVSR